MSGQNEDVNVRLPTWAGDWLGFQNYELRVSLEIDSTKEDDLTMLGPRLAKNLTGKAWEMVAEVDRERLKAKDGAEYLMRYLRTQRGRDHVDLMGDALHDMFSKADVVRKDSEEFMDYLPRFRHYVKAVDQAFKGVSNAKPMPQEFYGWFLLNQCLRLEPSDVANVKAKAHSYAMEDIVNAVKVMWSGGGLAQKDQERKKWKAMGKAYLQTEEAETQGIYGVGEDEEEVETETDTEKDTLEEVTAALMVDPENEDLLTAFQDAKRRVQYKEARKLLAKSRTARDYYPVANRFTRDKNRAKDSNASSSASTSTTNGTKKEFPGKCMRCGKYGHKARDCPQKDKRPAGVKYNADGGSALLVRALATDDSKCHYMDGENAEMVLNVATPEKKGCTGIIDSGASETIVGVETLQDIADEYEKWGFNVSEEISVDRSLHKSFIYGNNQVAPALGLAKINIGLYGVEKVIEAHVVEGATPLLISAKVMYEWGMIVDFRSGKAQLPEQGIEVKLDRAPSYHLHMPIGNFPGRRDARQDCIYLSEQSDASERRESE